MTFKIKENNVIIEPKLKISHIIMKNKNGDIIKEEKNADKTN